MRIMEFAMIQTRAARAMGLFALLTFAAVMLALRPFLQDPRYHDFAGPRMPVVASNAAFLLAAMAGFFSLARVKAARSASVYAFFLGTLATCLGSTYYHLWPNDGRLVYDRLGMIICFAAIVAMLFEERLDLHVLPLLLALGVASIVWWRMTGDLRPYGFIQFFPMLVIGVLLVTTKPRFTHSYALILVGVLYALAKAFELFDRPIYDALGVSGHTLKHLTAGAATAVVAWWVYVRRPVRGTESRTADPFPT
jgi:predicted membrane channel-forming protein YqfA (hemolysin III family)